MPFRQLKSRVRTSPLSSSGKNWVSEMAYSIKFRPAVEKDLRTLPQKELIKIKRKIDALAEHLPDPAITKMKGNNSFHKIRVGDYRIIYEIHDETLLILVAKIGHRKDIYKQLPGPS
jgi:mRNA interferase RelE/StbE